MTTTTSAPVSGVTEARDLFEQMRALAEQHDSWRGRTTLNLNAANNVMSAAARQMLPTRLADKGISGGLGRRHHMGGHLIDELETILVKLGQSVFRAANVEYRPASGSLANALAIASVLPHGATMMALGDGAPGHLSYRTDGWGGHLASKVVDLPFDFEALDVDIPAFRQAAERERPELIVLGTQMLIFPYSLGAIREVADSVGALVMYDGAHAMGLFAGGAFQDPLRQGADLVTGSTQKSLPGPIGGLILSQSPELGERIFDVCTRLVSNYENNRAAALGVTFAEMAAFGPAYAAAMVANAQTLAGALAERGFRPVGAGRGYTQTNQVLLEVSDCGAADNLAERWERANIIVTAVHLPGPRLSAGRPTDGIRIGVQEVTRLGMGTAEMVRIADLMVRAADRDDLTTVGRQVADLVGAFPTVYYCFENPSPAVAARPPQNEPASA